MNLALKKQIPLDRIVVVDMAPVKVKLSTDFAKYVIAMKEIQQANVQKQSEADAILKKCVPVSPTGSSLFLQYAGVHAEAKPNHPWDSIFFCELLGSWSTPVLVDKPEEKCLGRWIQLPCANRDLGRLAGETGPVRLCSRTGPI